MGRPSRARTSFVRSVRFGRSSRVGRRSSRVRRGRSSSRISRSSSVGSSVSGIDSGSSRIVGGSSSVAGSFNSRLGSVSSSVSSRRRFFRGAGGESESSGRGRNSKSEFERHGTDPSDGSQSASGRQSFPGGARLFGCRAQKHKMLKHCVFYSLVDGVLTPPLPPAPPEENSAPTLRLQTTLNQCGSHGPSRRTRLGARLRHQTATGALMCASGA